MYVFSLLKYNQRKTKDEQEQEDSENKEGVECLSYLPFFVLRVEAALYDVSLVEAYSTVKEICNQTHSRRKIKD